jgi:hypothetical protein
MLSIVFIHDVLGLKIRPRYTCDPTTLISSTPLYVRSNNTPLLDPVIRAIQQHSSPLVISLTDTSFICVEILKAQSLVWADFGR